MTLQFERQFKPGMTWELVLSGAIQLDHIRPVAKFNLLDPEQVKRCFHFSNLQPLFKLDNLSKRDKVGLEYGNVI